ncbi:MAG TPA: PEP-CTERM sorting domain-containing protein [Pyrinomonadaceae bacterium]|jgi:hypothetical protein
MKRYSTSLRAITFGFVLCLLFATQCVARADEVTFSGYTDGCFSAGCVPTVTSGLQTASVAPLTYTNATFSGTTTGGTFNLNAPTQPSGTQNLNNLGVFFRPLNAPPLSGITFNLLVTFTAPVNLTGGSPQQFQALVTGVTFNPPGGPFTMDFDNTPRLFTYSYTNGQGQLISGSFLFSVNDVPLPPGTGVVTGQITEASEAPEVPEPTALLLFGTGLAGVAGGLRRQQARRAR